jgi:GMP synthase (glutamine-hydrolysing)
MIAVLCPFASALPDRMATRIVNEIKGINRVVYDDASKPPGTVA